MRPILAKKYASESYNKMKKDIDLSDLSRKKKCKKVLMKVDEMADFFLN